MFIVNENGSGYNEKKKKSRKKSGDDAGQEAKERECIRMIT